MRVSTKDSMASRISYLGAAVAAALEPRLAGRTRCGILCGSPKRMAASHCDADSRKYFNRSVSPLYGIEVCAIEPGQGLA